MGNPELDPNTEQRGEEESRYWFGAKLYGWGWRPPLNWRGWVAYVAWLIVWLAACPFMNARQHPFQSLALFFGMIVVLLGMCKWKGEP